MLNFEPVCFAHRGLHGDRSVAPENSMEAFRRCIDAGYGFELDIQLTKDEQVVVFHDDTLERVCGVPGEIGDYTYQELQRFPLYDSDQRIPLFSEVLKLNSGKVPMIIELKAPGRGLPRKLCELTAAMLDLYKGPFCIESFHPLIVYWFRQNRPAIRRGQLCTDYFRTHAKGQRWQFFLVETMLTNFFTKPDFIAYDHHYMNALFFRLWRRKITAVAWTVRSKDELKKCKKVYQYYIMERVASS